MMAENALIHSINRHVASVRFGAMKKIAFAVLFLTIPALANAGGMSQDSQRPFRMDEVLQLPAGGLSLIRSGDELIIMSGNGRYVVRGTVYDMWNEGKAIKTMDDARKYMGRINLNKMHLDMNDLITFHLGEQGKPVVTVFVDPMSQASEMLVKNLAVVRGYSFDVVVAAAMQRQSAEIARRLACMAETNNKGATEAVANWNFNFLPEDRGCGVEKLQRTLVTLQVLGINGFPALIAPDGRVFNGVPGDINAFLAGGDK